MSTPTELKVAEVEDLLNQDTLAVEIGKMWSEYKANRKRWEDECTEANGYVFATDTTQTSNSSNPWRNKTVLPKLCQVRDNLHANYMAALFPKDDWLKWEAYDDDSSDKDKANIITMYMENKLRIGAFRRVVSQMVYDFIDYGNVIGDVEYVKESYEDAKGVERVLFEGPRAVRVSPLDIVFNPLAGSFLRTPKITRKIYTLADLSILIEDNPSLGFTKEMLTKLLDIRKGVTNYESDVLEKAVSFSRDGFGDLSTYYGSGTVEVLEFEGDIYDTTTNTLKRNRVITIADRSIILRDIEHPSWKGASTKHHVGWRTRPDNLYAMGPLVNLVGMQYRIDHLENLKADMFDLIAFPPLKIRGDVPDFVWQPLEKIYLDEGEDVTMLVPDTTVLNADFQITNLENKMEEMVGAPKQAMGIRSPGEKTAYEVQTLDNASGRMFHNKISYFEENFMEPMINDMLEVARRELDTTDIIRVLDDDLGVEQFISITKEDIMASGRIRPVGSRHFAAKASALQNLTQLANSVLGQDPAVKAHMSGKKMALLIEDLLGLSKYDLFGDNIGITEQVETQQLMQQMQQPQEGAPVDETPAP